VLLPVVLFVGVGTLLRLGSANYHDAICVTGMNRIRGAYLEIAPELRPYFVMSPNDDAAGINLTMAQPPHLGVWTYIVGATPFLVTVLNAVIAAAILAIVALRLQAATAVVLALAVVAFGIVIVLESRYARSNMELVRSMARPLFPSPSTGDRQVY
jgi:hypothetical protein